MSSIQIYDKINTWQYFLFTPFLGGTDHSVLRKYIQHYLTSITRILGTFVLLIQHYVVKECTWQSIQTPALCIGRRFILHYVKLSSGPDHQNEQFFRAVKEHRAPQLIFSCVLSGEQVVNVCKSSLLTSQQEIPQIQFQCLDSLLRNWIMENRFST